MRLAVISVALAITSSSGWTADLNARNRPEVSSPFAPTSPVGVASELPRSPLADVFVNGSIRFSSVSEAQAHCPGDRIVKVETWSNVYRPARGLGEGAFMCQVDASSEGDRPR